MIETEAVLTCPYCGKSYRVNMPTDRCVVMLKCRECGNIMTPKEGDCCVFCSYADKKCPGKQEENTDKGGEKHGHRSGM